MKCRTLPRAGSLSRSSSTMRSAVFLPMPGMRVRRARSPRANRSYHLVGGHAAQDLDRERWTNSAHGQQLLKELLFGQTQESVQAERIFANMGVDVERDVSACGWHFRERRHADRNVIAYAMRFHDGLVRMLSQQRSSKMRNHLEYCIVSMYRGVLYGSPGRRQKKYSFSFSFHKKFAAPQYLHSGMQFPVAQIFLLPQSACSQKREMF